MDLWDWTFISRNSCLLEVLTPARALVKTRSSLCVHTWYPWLCYSGLDVFYVCLAGKRISQKLLRNCTKFLSIIHDVLKIAPMEFIRQSADEIEIRGPESKYDTRKLNSYPSKVGCPQLCCAYCPFSVFLRRLAFCVQFTAFKICFSRYS